MTAAASYFRPLATGLLSLAIAWPLAAPAGIEPGPPARTESCGGIETATASGCGANPEPLAANELQGKICQASIQNRIAWDYEGRRRWAKANLERICKNAKYSLQPGACFERVMHGGISYGNGTRWHWSQALRLCAGTQDSGATISCFTRAISAEMPWREAIELCRVKP